MDFFFFSLTVWSYRYRDEKIQADLNKLYDTQPTKSTDTHNGRLQIVAPPPPASGGRGTSTEEGVTEQGAPYFDLEHSGNVTAVLNKPVLLNCRVKNIANKTVSPVPRVNGSSRDVSVRDHLHICNNWTFKEFLAPMHEFFEETSMKAILNYF